MIGLMASMYHFWVKSTEDVDWLLQIRLSLLIWQPIRRILMAQMAVGWHWGKTYGVKIDLMIGGNRDTPCHTDACNSY